MLGKLIRGYSLTVRHQQNVHTTKIVLNPQISQVKLNQVLFE